MKKLSAHLKSLGFSNRLALYAMAFLLVGLAGGFVLAYLSIRANYSGALTCWTIAFTPLGALIGAVPCLVVRKSETENTGSSDKSGEGIKYAAAKAAGFIHSTVNPEDQPI